MSAIDSYHSLRGLPPLAGITNFSSAAGPGLGIEACVDRHKRYHYAFLRIWKTCIARLTAEPLYELKMGWSYHAYLASENVSAFRSRVAEMRHPPLGLDKVPDDALKTFFDEILNAPDAWRVVAGLYGEALPALRRALERHLEDTNPLVDAPSVRIIRSALNDLAEMQAWGDAARLSLEADLSEEDKAEGNDWRNELRAWLSAAGGLEGSDAAASPPGSKRFSATPYEFDSQPQRDERFPDPYNMGVHAEEFLYDEKFANRDKVLMMFYKRIREIDVPEMMAPILYEMSEKIAQEGEDQEDAGTYPWDFYRDLTRQLWDEARHAMMGEIGFAKNGIDWPNLVMVNKTWSEGLNAQLTPKERHAVLWFIEQGLMGKTGKRYEWEVGRDAEDEFAELIQDYDWADEVLHARIGRDWYVKNFDTVKEAADYGSACWDKVLSDWEGIREKGLTEHRNWWPDLYREASRLRGEEPAEETLAYNKSYAETRADLERISASG